MSKPPGGIPLTGLAAATPAAPLTNQQILESNRAEVLAFARTITHDYQPKTTDIETKRAEIQAAAEQKRKEAAQLVKGGKLRDAMQLLHEAKDNKLGIAWHPQELSDKSWVIVRDARCETLDVELLSKEAGEKYAIQVLNEVAGALALVDKAQADSADKNLARKKLQFIAENVVADGSIDNLNSSTVRKFNTQIIHSLEAIGLDKKEAAEQLVFAKEIGNFKNSHHHLATIFTQENGQEEVSTVVEADVMLTKLSDRVKEDFEEIQKKPRTQEVLWFDKLPNYQKQLIKDVTPEILSERKMSPAQLVSTLPGLRNAYHKTTMIIPGNNSPEQILLDNFHISTPASRASTPEEGQKMTLDNMQHLQSYSSRPLNFNMLNGEAPIPGASNWRNTKGIENDLVKQVRTGVSNLGADATLTISPINILRRVGAGRDASEYKEILNKIANGLTQGDTPTLTQEQAAYFAGNGSKQPLVDFIDRPTTDSKLSSMLQTMVRCKELADTPITALSDSKHINFEMSTKMNAILGSATIEGGALYEKLPDELRSELPENVDFCKSGKDRTGYVGVGSSHEALNLHFGIDPNSSIARQNFLRQAAANHAQTLTGRNAGSQGCDSMKFDDNTQLKGYAKEFKAILSQKSAGFNSKIKTIEESRFSRGTPKHDKAIAEFEERFEEHQESQALAAAQAHPPTPGPAQTTSPRRQTPSSPAQAPATPTAGTPTAQSSEPLLSGTLKEKQQIFESVLMNFEAITKSAQTAAELQAAITEFKAYVEEFRQAVEESKGQQQGQSVQQTQQPTQAQAPDKEPPGDKSAVFAAAIKVGKDIKGSIVSQLKGQEDAPTSDILKKIKQDKLLQKSDGTSKTAARAAGHNASTKDKGVQ